MPKSSRAPGLDLLRALAVTMVIVFHFSNDANHAIFSAVGGYGWMGVDLFFVLSGFLIGTQLFRSISKDGRIRLIPYFGRRFLRTLPNFLVVLTIYIFFESLRERPDLAPTWKYLTFTQNIGLDRHLTGAFSHAWSLCVEEQFYVLFPFLSLLAIPYATAQRLMALFFFLLTGGMALRAGLWHWLVEPMRSTAQGQFGSIYDQYLYYPTYSHLDGLLVGIVLALIKVFRPSHWQWLLTQGPLALILSGSLLALSTILDKYSFIGAAMIFPLIALAFGLLVIASLSPKLFISSWKIPGVSSLAVLSYGIYLIQKLVFHSATPFLAKIGIPPYTYLGFFIIGILCVIFAAILHFIVERPGLRLREQYFKAGSGSDIG